MIIIWENIATRPENLNVADQDSLLGAFPIKNIYLPHGGYGVVDAQFSNDSKHLFTLSSPDENGNQAIGVWDWTSSSNEPKLLMPITGSQQSCLKLNPFDSFEIMTAGKDDVFFFSFDLSTSEFNQFVPEINRDQLKLSNNGFSTCIYSPHEGNALVCTVDGEIVILSNKSLDNLSIMLPRGEKTATKVLKLHNGPIQSINMFKSYIITGGQDGAVKVHDENFRILYWNDKLHAGGILNIQCDPFGESMILYLHSLV